MIPSRGLSWSSQSIGVGRRRIGVLATRQFSSSTVQQRQLRANPLLSNAATASIRQAPRLRSPIATHILRSGAGLRFASTTPSPTPVETTSTPVSSADLSTPLDSFSSIDPQTITNLPEQIGYLKALGLDFGIGPTSVAQWLLEHVHVYAGTPWWISIGLTALVVRALLFRPYVWAAETSTKMRAIKPLTDPIRAKMMMASSAGNTQLTMETRNELSRIHQRAGIVVWKGFLAPLGQGLLGFGTFFLLRAMAKLPVPGLEVGGALWFHNLAIPDPYFILPLATAAMGHWMFRIGGETGQSTLTPLMQRAFMYGFPVLTLAFTWWLPAAVQFSFFATSFLSLIQSLLFRSDAIRKAVGMSPKPVEEPAVLSPYKGNMKIAAPTPSTLPSSRLSNASTAVLSTSQLNSRFQQPSNLSSTSASASPSRAREAEPPTAATSALMDKLKGQFSDMSQFRRDLLLKGKSSLENRQKKAEKAEAEAFEKKRAEEIKTRRQEEVQRRRAERAAKRARRDGEEY